MNHVLQVPNDEPVATLTYGNDTFEIPYALFRDLSTWVASGSLGYDNAKDTVAAIRFIEASMAYDSMPKIPESLRESYRKAGLTIDRPIWK